jgi:hypothetical protein
MSYVSPDDAEALWCPLVKAAQRIITPNSRNLEAHNRLFGTVGKIIPEHTHCISDECMFWREKHNDPLLGYCGAAGPPDSPGGS